MDEDKQLFEVWKDLFVKAQTGPVDELDDIINISVTCFHTAVAGLGQFKALNDIRNARDTEEA